MSDIKKTRKRVQAPTRRVLVLGSPAAPHPVEVEWHETRATRDGGEDLFFVKGERTPAGWNFFERNGWELSWFVVADALKQHCTEKARQILLRAAASPGPTRPDVEVGNVYDNSGVLSSAKLKLLAGNVDDAQYMLAVLWNHVVASPDSKSRMLLPMIEELFEAATSAARKKVEIEKNGLAEGLRPIGKLDATAGGQDEGAQRDRVSVPHVKARLFDATVLATTVTFAVGVLVHDMVGLLPELATWPVTAHVMAGSGLAIAFLAVRPRGG